jgi:hypothetical protein
MEVEEHIDRMFQMFGQLPNPVQEPKRFAYYVKLYKYYVSKNEEMK